MGEPFFFTWSAQKGARSLRLSGGEGAHFDTEDQGRFLDLGSLIYQVNAGHGHKRIIEAVREQASRLCVSVPGAIYPEKRALAEALLERAPEGFTKVFFTLGGSDANENALKMARLFTGRYKAISRYRSYHGSSLGAVSLTGDWRRSAVEPVLPGVIHVLDLDRAAGREASTDIPRVLELEHEVGAVFLEPVVGHNGVLIPPPGYFRAVREACDAHGALLVVDEVLTGFGRTGKWFAHEHFDGVVPDLITCGKALTGGYGALGAVLVHERVAAHFEENVLAAGLTHYAHPLAVAAALETLRVYEDEGLIDRAAALEAPLAETLAGIVALHPRIATAHRQIGLLGALDLAFDGEQFAALGAALGRRKIHAHLNPKVGCLVVAPPLCITEEELEAGLESVAEAIDEVARGEVI